MSLCALTDVLLCLLAMPPASAVCSLQAMAASVRTMLGPATALKIASDAGGDPIVTSDVLEVLGALQVRQPAAALLREAVAGQQYGCGSGGTTLASLAGYLAVRARVHYWPAATTWPAGTSK